MMEPPRPAACQRCAARTETSQTARMLTAIRSSKSLVGRVSASPSLTFGGDTRSLDALKLQAEANKLNAEAALMRAKAEKSCSRSNQ